MRKTILYSVTISWPELVDFLSEEYLDLLSKRLNVDRENLTSLPISVSGIPNHISIYNEVEDG